MKLISILLCVAGFVAAAELPPLATPGKGALLSTDLIYSLEDRPTPQCHASTIAETSTGLVAAWFAGTREKHTDVGIRVSHLVNGKWTASVAVSYTHLTLPTKA